MSGNVLVGDHLDADLTLSWPEGQPRCSRWPGCTGCPARSEPGWTAIVRCFADMTIRSFIARLACALTHPAGAALG